MVDKVIVKLRDAVSEKASSLNLGYSQLVSLKDYVEFIDEFSSLTELCLDGNSLSDFPDGFCRLPQLTTLILTNNLLDSLPEAICHLKNLVCLSLDNNCLDGLPKTIGQLSQLEDLTLSRNELITLPETIGCLDKLENLNLVKNKLSTIPESIGLLRSLRKLDLSNNKLSSLPNGIGNLENLRELNLSCNNLIEIPESIGNLTQLTKLYLDENQLTSLPESIGGLVSLTELDLSCNKLVQLPDSIFELTELETLSVPGNQLTSLPKNIGNLRSLRELYVYDNSLSSLPSSIGNLQHLGELDVSNNKLTTLPEEIGFFILLDIDVSMNKLISPPQRTAEEGVNAIHRWFEQEKVQGTVDNFETKVIILGSPEVGKTSLRRKIESIHNELPRLKDRTVGVDLFHWDIDVDVDGKEEKGIAHLFDFGGQKIQHMMHQFFLSEGAFHIVVTNGRQNSSELDYWFSCFFPLKKDLSSPRILPIFNKFDRKQDFPDFSIFNSRGVLPALSLNLKDDNGYVLRGVVEQIKEYVSDHIKENYETVLTSWKVITEELLSLSDDYIDISRFRSICEENELVKLPYQDDLLKDLHKRGYVLYFEDIQLDVIFINPNWLIKAIYTLFRPENDLIDCEGYFYEKNLKAVWANDENNVGCYRYTDREQQFLFNLLLRGRFNICYATPEVFGRYLVPQCLPEEPKREGWNQFFSKIKESEKVEVEVQNIHCGFDVLPIGLISKIIVDLQHLIEVGPDGSLSHWKGGMVLKLSEAKALLEAANCAAYGSYLAVEMVGNISGVEGLKSRILGTVQKIFDTAYRAYVLDCYVPCGGCVKSSLKRGHKYMIADNKNDVCVYGHIREIKSGRSNKGTTMVINNINFNGNNSGVINFGAIKGDVSNIAENLASLTDDSKHRELADALRAVVQSIVDDSELLDDTRASAISSIKLLSEQANLPAGQRAGYLMATVKGMGTILDTATKARAVWDTWYPSISAYFE